MPSDDLKNEISVASSGQQNIYEVLEITSPREMLQKAIIVAAIIKKMEHNGVTLTEASTIAKINNERLTQILIGHFHNIPLSELKNIKNSI